MPNTAKPKSHDAPPLVLAPNTPNSRFPLADMVSRLDEAVASFDQPSMDGVNSYFVSWAARQAGLKVALSGLGSDELFGGYTAFRATSKVARVAACRALFPGRSANSPPPSSSHATYRRSPDVFRKALPRGSIRSFFRRLIFSRGAFHSGTVAGRLRRRHRVDELPWTEWLATNAARNRRLWIHSRRSPGWSFVRIW